MTTGHADAEESTTDRAPRYVVVAVCAFAEVGFESHGGQFA
jgi:hypothetical protein